MRFDPVGPLLDALTTAEGAGLLAGRNQLVDSNWIVCEQNIAPGERVTGDVEGQIDFGVVKRGETCP